MYFIYDNFFKKTFNKKCMRDDSLTFDRISEAGTLFSPPPATHLAHPPPNVERTGELGSWDPPPLTSEGGNP